MPLAETLIVSLGVRFGKLLLKNYLEEPGEALGAELLDIAKGKIKDTRDQREARRQFESFGERIAEQLLPVFQAAAQRGDLNAEAVVFELAKALDALPSAAFVVKHDLDPAKIATELKKAHPLPRGQFSVPEEDLYQRALIESARYIVEVAAKLPQFEVTQARESLQRLTRIGDVVEDTAKNVRYIKDWVERQEDDSASRRYETDYRLAVMRNLDYVELFGADLSLESKKQSLSVAYVSLNLESPSGEEDGSESLPVETVLDSLVPKSGRLLIRGEAGSGKSTLFRWTGIESARGKTWQLSLQLESYFETAGKEENTTSIEQYRGGRRHLGDSWRKRIPFLIRLRDCSGGKLPSPSSFPEMIAKEIGSPPADWIRSILHVGRGLILLDGIDEVPDDHRETVRGEIEAIVRAYPQSYFVVSTRPEAVPAYWLAHLGFREARVNPMSDLDRERFIEKWHEAVAKQLELMGRAHDDLEVLAQELKQRLSENPPVARLAANPLLCAMICALHRDRGQKLPESQPELCEALCQVLLHRRERESGLDISQFPAPYRSLMYPQKRVIVQEIAHYMVLNEESSITIDRAREKVADALRILSGQSEGDAGVVCQALVERSGMLREAKPGSIDFIHNTFKEYLAADRFANSSDVGLLVQRALDPTWRRVVLFAVATSRPGFADELIRRVLGEGTMESLHARQLLALQARAATLFLEPRLEERLEAVVKTMFPPKTMTDAEALAASGDVAVPYLVFRESLKAPEATACIRALRLIATKQARKALKGYLGDERSSVVSELSQATNPLTIGRVVQWVQVPGSLPEGIKSQIKDLSPLAGLSNLQILDLRGTQVSDVSPLSGLPNLRILLLNDTPLSSISPLSGLSSLQRLELSRTQVSDVSPLSKVSSLRILLLNGTPLSDVSPLSGLSALQGLDLSFAALSDVSSLSGLSSLQSLLLHGTQVSDVSPLSSIKGLHIYR